MVVPKSEVKKLDVQRNYKYFFISAANVGNSVEGIILVDSIDDLQAYTAHSVMDKQLKWYDCLGEQCPFCKQGDNYAVRFFVPIYFPERNGVSFFAISPTEKEVYLDQLFGSDAPIQYGVKIMRLPKGAATPYQVSISTRPVPGRTVLGLLTEVGLEPKVLNVGLLVPSVTPTTPPTSSSYTTPPPPPPMAAPPAPVPTPRVTMTTDANGYSIPAPPPAPVTSSVPTPPTPPVAAPQPESAVVSEATTAEKPPWDEKTATSATPTLPADIPLPEPVDPASASYNFMVEG